MENQEILDSYIPFVDFIAETAGIHNEVLLYDTTTPKISIIASRNSHHSDSYAKLMADYILHIINNKDYEKRIT